MRLVRVCVSQGDTKSHGIVRRRKRDGEGNPVSNSNGNPLLDTSQCEAQFDSGEVEAHTADTIAESIHAEVDDDGHMKHLLSEIVDHSIATTEQS